MVDVGLLKKFSLFKDLDKRQLQKFVAYIKERHYSAGKDLFAVNYICHKGGRGDEIFLVKKGSISVELPMYRYDSGYKTISAIGEGNFFGELSFFDGQKRSANVIANGEVELLVLSRRDFDKVIKDNLEEGCRIQSKIIARLVGIIRKMNETYSSAFFRL
jgi:CRP-like cAMP-binding protein